MSVHMPVHGARRISLCSLYYGLQRLLSLGCINLAAPQRIFRLHELRSKSGRACRRRLNLFNAHTRRSLGSLCA